MKKRQKRTAAVILALSMLASPSGIPVGVLAESQKNPAGIHGYTAESAKEGYSFAESLEEPSLEKIGTADSKGLTEMELQTGGISMQMETAEVNYQKADLIGSTVTYSGQTAQSCTLVKSSAEAVTEGWTPEVTRESDLSYAVKYTHTDGRDISKTVTIAKGQPSLTNAETYKEDGITSASIFGVGEKIIVKAIPEFLPNNAVMTATFAEPTGGQMAVYYNNTQISPSSAVDGNGVHTMTVDTSDLPPEALNKETALTVRYIESGNASGANTEVKVTVTAVAKVENGSSTTYVGNLDDAFKDENDGAIITLLADVTRTEYLPISIGCILDLGGHTISGNLGTSDYILVITGKNVTIQGDGGISGTGMAKVLQISGNVIIKGGTFSCAYGNCIFVTGSNASLSITGSKVRVENTGGYGLLVNSNSSVQLSAGTYSAQTGQFRLETMPPSPSPICWAIRTPPGTPILTAQAPCPLRASWRKNCWPIQ